MICLRNSFQAEVEMGRFRVGNRPETSKWPHLTDYIDKRSSDNLS